MLEIRLDQADSQNSILHLNGEFTGLEAHDKNEEILKMISRTKAKRFAIEMGGVS